MYRLDRIDDGAPHGVALCETTVEALLRLDKEEQAFAVQILANGEGAGDAKIRHQIVDLSAEDVDDSVILRSSYAPVLPATQSDR